VIGVAPEHANAGPQPAQVETFQAGEDAVLAATTDGSVHAVWSSNDQLWARTRDPEGVWDQPQPIMTAPWDILWSWGLAKNPIGDVCIWWHGQESDVAATRTPTTQNTSCWDDQQRWSGRLVVGTGTGGSVSSGLARIASALTPEAEFRSLYTYGWSTADYGDLDDYETIADGSDAIDHPALAIDSAGRVHTSWYGVEGDIRYRRSDDGVNWEPEEGIPDPTDGLGAERRLVADGDGRVFMLVGETHVMQWGQDQSWRELTLPDGFGQSTHLTTDPGGHVILAASYSGEAVFAVANDDGEFTDAQSLALDVAQAPSSSVPFSFAVDTEGLAHVLWADSSGAVTVVSLPTPLDSAGLEGAAGGGGTSADDSDSLLVVILLAGAIVVAGLIVAIALLVRGRRPQDPAGPPAPST
jgi:hypothetical protein